MNQIGRVTRPFGEVAVSQAQNGLRSVRATVRLDVCKTGVRTGLALDASGSMEASFNDAGGNGSQVQRVGRAVSEFLAREIDGGSETEAVFWAMGKTGGDIQVIGGLTQDAARNHPFDRPTQLGGGTRLVPACRHFEERFREAPYGLFAFLTDGRIDDLIALERWSRELAESIRCGRRNPIKLVLIGFGSGVDEDQIARLANLSEGGTPLGLWGHGIADTFETVPPTFFAVVRANARVAAGGRVLDPDGRVLRDYATTGVPGVIEFEAPEGAAHFTLVIGGRKYHQRLSDDGTNLPPSDPLPGEDNATLRGVTPGTQFVKDMPLVLGVADPGGSRADSGSVERDGDGTELFDGTE
jgi:hypothetical protein